MKHNLFEMLTRLAPYLHDGRIRMKVSQSSIEIDILEDDVVLPYSDYLYRHGAYHTYSLEA